MREPEVEHVASAEVAQESPDPDGAEQPPNYIR